MGQHHEWHGTPYRYGGLSKHGVDCSGFVYLTFRNMFSISLPRSTEQQSNTGVHISQTQLHAGDLVFFRTGFSKTHVGIYLDKRRFLHASTSKGVMISNMDNAYWRDKFWKAQRI
jgi:cell wall-associated NlpC family hydrolase